MDRYSDPSAAALAAPNSRTLRDTQGSHRGQRPAARQQQHVPSPTRSRGSKLVLQPIQGFPMQKITPAEVDRHWAALLKCRPPGAIRLAARPPSSSAQPPLAAAARVSRSGPEVWGPGSRFGSSGQIVSTDLLTLMADPDRVRAKRVADTMSAMVKIDLARCGPPGPTRRSAQCRRRPRGQGLRLPKGRTPGMPAVLG